MDEPTRRLRLNIFEFILQHCRPPTINELAKCTDCRASDVARRLQILQDLHHLKLYENGVPSPTPIAMVHPFSHIPTPYVVIQDEKSWYANCAWCAFGLAAMLSPAEVLVSVLTHRGENLRFQVKGGDVQGAQRGDGKSEPPGNFFAIFSPPPSQWWTDVRFACSTIQICTSRDEADQWHSLRGFHSGTVPDMATLWKLSKVWYHDKPTYEYERKTPEEAASLFRELGMSAEYWST